MKDWFEIKAAVGSQEADVYIYDEIGDGFFSEGVAAKRFVQDLAAIRASNINLRVNSPGGSVFDGQAIYNALKRHPATVTTYIDGLAASIASTIAMAGDKVVMARNALFMIHNPFGNVRGGTAADMRSAADVLDKITATMREIYSGKSGMSTADVTTAMDAESWYSATEAQLAGFADEIGDAIELAASVDIESLTAMGYHLPDKVTDAASGLPLAGKDVSWDGAAAAKRMRTAAGGNDFDPAKYGRGFFWHDATKPKLAGSYKLPFADVIDGKLTAVPAGIHAAAQRLSQTNLPSGDVAGVKAAIAAYYRRMDEKAPWESAAPNVVAAGRVLSQANYDKLIAARDGINAVLTSSGGGAAGGDDEPPEPGAKAPSDTSVRLTPELFELVTARPLKAKEASK